MYVKQQQQRKVILLVQVFQTIYLFIFHAPIACREWKQSTNLLQTRVYTHTVSVCSTCQNAVIHKVSVLIKGGFEQLGTVLLNLVSTLTVIGKLKDFFFSTNTAKRTCFHC